MSPASREHGPPSVERLLVRGLVVATLFGLFLTGGQVTFRTEVFRGFVFVCLVAGLAAVALVAPLWRGRTLLVGRAVALGAALVGWVALRQLTAERAGYFGDYQLAKLLALGLWTVALAAHAEHLTPRFLARVLAACLVVTAGWALLGAGLGWDGPGFGFHPPLTLGFGNSNMLGVTAAVATVLVAGLAPPAEAGRPERAARVLAVLCGAGLVVASQSRNAIFMSIGGGLLLILLAARGRRLSVTLARLAGFSAACAAVLTLAGGAVFQRKVERMVSGVSSSDAGRVWFAQVAWDRITGDPATFFLGAGLSSFARAYHGVHPEDFGRVFYRAAVELVHCEYLEWWHDAGLVGVAGFLAVLGVTAAAGGGAWRRRADGPGAALLAALAVWAAMATFTVATRYVGAQALLGVLLGLAWRAAPARPALAPRGRAAAVAVAALALVASGVAFRYERSDRLLLRANRALADPGGGARAVELAQEAVAWKPGNAWAHYALLQMARGRGDVAAAERHFDALQAYAPQFLASEAHLAHALAVAGDYRRACALLESYRDVAPYDFAELTAWPAYAFAAGDAPLLNRSLVELLASAVRVVNERERVEHRTRRVESGGEPALEIDPAGEPPTVALPCGRAAGVLLGTTPASVPDARRLVAAGINRFLREELGSRTDVLPGGEAGSVRP